MTTATEFWKAVHRGKASECWTWKNCLSNGYGVVQWAGRITKAHRVAWLITNGPIPAGQCICHKCDNRKCCNPSHLFVGTRAENNRDMWGKGRGKIKLNGGWNRIDLKPEWTAKLGTMPDYKLAAEAGTCKEVIARHRAASGIAPYALTTGNNGRYKHGNYPARWKGVVSNHQRA